MTPWCYKDHKDPNNLLFLVYVLVLTMASLPSWPFAWPSTLTVSPMKILPEGVSLVEETIAGALSVDGAAW